MIALGTVASFDVETTGVDVENDRIVTAYVGLHDAVVDETIGAWMINPGVPIPAEAAAIHGIDDAMVAEDGADPAEAIAEIESALVLLTEQRVPLVVMNAPFDFSILDREVGRHLGRPLDFDPDLVLDPLVLDKAVDPFRKGRRTLTALADHYGIPFEDAHTAQGDAAATAAVIRPILDAVVLKSVARGYPEGAITLDLLQIWQQRWKAEQQRSLHDYHANVLGKPVAPADYPTEWPMIPRSNS